MFDWNDLRHFLALARTGSTGAAAKAGGVDPSTLAHRIAALEEAVGAVLFERSRAGYRLNARGIEIAAAAERVEAEMAVLPGRFAAHDRDPRATLRLTCAEPLARRLLLPIVGEFGRAHPEINVEIVVDNRHLDLERGEADVAVRAGADAAAPGTFGRKLVELGWTVFCSPELLEGRPLPSSPASLAGAPVLLGDGDLSDLAPYRWFAGLGGRVAGRSGRMEELLSAGAAGLGFVMLPAPLAALEPGLVRCFPLIEGITTPLWLLAPERLRDAPALRALLDFMPHRVQALVERHADGLAPAVV